MTAVASALLLTRGVTLGNLLTLSVLTFSVPWLVGLEDGNGHLLGGATVNIP